MNILGLNKSAIPGFAVGECPIPDLGDAIRDRNRLQPAATLEGTFSDLGDPLRNRHRRQPAAVLEGKALDLGDPLGIITEVRLL